VYALFLPKTLNVINDTKGRVEKKRAQVRVLHVQNVLTYSQQYVLPVLHCQWQRLAVYTSTYRV
jgi:hypothetical protein